MTKKLDWRQKVKVHRLMTSDGGPGATALARKLGVSRTTIYRARDEVARAVVTSVGREAAQAAAEQGPFGEFGVTGLSRFGGTIREDYDKDWQTLTKMVPLVKEMLDHPIVGAVNFAVEMSIRGAEWTVSPAGETPVDAEAAEFLESCTKDMAHTFNDHISQAVSMIPYGFSVFEIVYKRRLGLDADPTSQFDDGRIGWRKLAFRAQDTLTPGDEWIFDEHGGVQGINQTAPPTWSKVSIPIEKMILYRTTAAKNNPQGRSALRPAYIPWYFSKNLAEVEGIAAERMGIGLPVMYLGEGTTKQGAESDLEFAKQAVRDIKADDQMGLVIPYMKMNEDGRGVFFELVSPPSRGMIDFHKTIERYNHQIAQVLLSQFIFLGLTEFGTQALAVRLTDFFSQAVAGWLQSMADTLNLHAVPRLFALNAFAGLSGFPKLTVGSIGEVDVEGLMKSLEIAVGSSLIVPDEGTERVVRQLLELPPRNSPEGGLPLSVVAAQEEDGPSLVPGGNGRAPVIEEMALRRNGRRKWERAVNAYQRELREAYETWAEDLAVDLETADEDQYEEVVAAALLLLSSRLAALGSKRIPEGMALGLGGASPSGMLMNRVGMRVSENERYISESLTPSLRDRILTGLKDPAVIALGMVGILGIMRPATARVEQYAGAMWAAIAEGVGEASKQEDDQRIYWSLDPRAQHCQDCLEWGNREYASFESMLAETGGLMPGAGVQCDGNCRCELMVFREGEWVRP